MAMYIMTSYGIITEYFDKHKGKAIALSTCFLGIGGLLGPLWIITSFSHYGYFGTMLIMTGLSLHIIPAALCFRPLKEFKESKTIENKLEVIKISSEKSLTCVSHKQPGNPHETDKFLKNENENYESCCTQLLRVTGLRNLSTPRVLAHMILSVGYAYLHGTSNTFTAGLAKEKYFDEGGVKLLMSLVNGLEILFRLGSGVLLDYFGDDRPLVYSIFMMMLGAMGTILPLLEGKIALICLWIFYQGFLGKCKVQALMNSMDVLSSNYMMLNKNV